MSFESLDCSRTPHIKIIVVFKGDTNILRTFSKNVFSIPSSNGTVVLILQLYIDQRSTIGCAFEVENGRPCGNKDINFKITAQSHDGVLVAPGIALSKLFDAVNHFVVVVAVNFLLHVINSFPFEAIPFERGELGNSSPQAITITNSAKVSDVLHRFGNISLDLNSKASHVVSTFSTFELGILGDLQFVQLHIVIHDLLSSQNKEQHTYAN